MGCHRFVAPIILASVLSIAVAGNPSDLPTGLGSQEGQIWTGAMAGHSSCFSAGVKQGNITVITRSGTIRVFPLKSVWFNNSACSGIFCYAGFRSKCMFTKVKLPDGSRELGCQTV